MLQQIQRNGRTKNDHRCFNANHLIIKRLTNAKTLIDEEFNSKSIGVFEFIERLIIDFRRSGLGCDFEWSIDPPKHHRWSVDHSCRLIFFSKRAILKY